MQDELFQFLGRLVTYGGGSAVVAFGVFRWLGAAWIENKFAAKLKQLEHDHALVLAKLKVEVDSQLNGALKFQERDFVVMPEVWDKLDAAFTHIQWLTSPMQEQPRVFALNDEELDEFLATDPMMAFQKQQIRAAQGHDRQKAYTEIKFLYQMGDVRKKFGEYQRYLAANAIFFTPALKLKLKEIEAVMWSAISHKQIGIDSGDFKIQGEAWEKMKTEAQPLRDEIELEIRSRLESHVKTASEMAST